MAVAPYNLRRNVQGGEAFEHSMNTHRFPAFIEALPQRLLEELAQQVPGMQKRALQLDRTADFPAEDMDRLRSLGAFAAPLPAELGGLGWGTQPESAVRLMQALRLLGQANLSVGRLYEAHVNALRLVVRFGDAEQVRASARDALDGHLFGLWVTDAPNAPLRVQEDGVLAGSKAPCSGAGFATRAVVTARLPSGGSYMLIIRTPGRERSDHTGWDTQGMRSACNGLVRLDGIRPTAVIGAAGDYLRQPDFSAGAWRTSAVTLGGMEALVAEMRRQLVQRERDGDPYQRARVGKAIIAVETARFWVTRAAIFGESHVGDANDIANTVNLARIAVEAACLDVLRIAQRALGLAAFRPGQLSELLLRDLATYLRQPAPDETLAEAAAHFMHRDMPEMP
jgi:alkylation response protein AidB-like acyl-CoA dehydrogenase